MRPGFTEYGMLYFGQQLSDGNTMNYEYGNSNEPGTWRDFEFRVLADWWPCSWTERVQDRVPEHFIPDGLTVMLPGHYVDGDGDDETGVTSSDVDWFEWLVPTAIHDGSWGRVKALF